MRALQIFAFSLLCAALLFVFSIIDGVVKFAFSLGAIYVGIQFFKRYETRGPRIAFVLITILFYFIYSVFYAVYLAIQQQQAAV
ncbi:hypothetical protein NLX71_00315 [Paenibacillus sp. MZ04-78.2]|uniref:hypothetical protein n=1 Tax=Paenibacillus sp. MZ04-78.2 TaxID=2962034 RepID=UPI0020B78D65|nr:hypothetical protein [Paenibacillus sp. MZ04-78.2]MCP3771765.1 hypothetical protein [Paenibacillus sp. MZ04-78.2]